jgi:hypothetical protein
VSGTNANNLNFDTGFINPSYANGRASGFFVRCLQE